MRKGQSIYSRHKKQWYLAEMETIQSESGLWHLRGAEGDRLSEQSEGKEAPAAIAALPSSSSGS